MQMSVVTCETCTCCGVGVLNNRVCRIPLFSHLGGAALCSCSCMRLFRMRLFYPPLTGGMQATSLFASTGVSSLA